GGRGGVGGGEPPRRPTHLADEARGTDEAQHRGAYARVTVVAMGEEDGYLRRHSRSVPFDHVREREGGVRTVGIVHQLFAEACEVPGYLGRSRIHTGTQQLGTQLLAADLSGYRIVATQRGAQERLQISSAFEAAERRLGRHAHGLAIVARRIVEHPPPWGLSRCGPEQPGVRLYEVRTIERAEAFRRAEKRLYLLGCVDARDRRDREDAVERRHEKPSIGRWSRSQSPRQRRDGAAGRRFDDERARRTAACEVGAHELLAERTQCRGIEQVGEGDRGPGSGGNRSRHLEGQRRGVPPEQDREHEPPARRREPGPTHPPRPP